MLPVCCGARSECLQVINHIGVVDSSEQDSAPESSLCQSRVSPSLLLPFSCPPNSCLNCHCCVQIKPFAVHGESLHLRGNGERQVEGKVLLAFSSCEGTCSEQRQESRSLGCKPPTGHAPVGISRGWQWRESGANSDKLQIVSPFSSPAFRHHHWHFVKHRSSSLALFPEASNGVCGAAGPSLEPCWAPSRPL